MAWGLSPKVIVKVPLVDFPPENYLAICRQALENLNWQISIIDKTGIIAFTGISWASYAEEISIRIVDNKAIVKSECVGYQMLFYDYSKNQQNIDLFFNEVEYAAYHLKNNIGDAIAGYNANLTENSEITLQNPPLAAKEKLSHVGTMFIFNDQFKVTPALVIINCVVYFAQLIGIIIIATILSKNKNLPDAETQFQDFWKIISGANNRDLVLSGQYWRLLTAIFSHVGFFHLAGNLIALVYIGSIIECRLGKFPYLLLYLLTGICASIVSILFRYDGYVMGASGAIFGLFGLFLALLCTDLYEKNARKAFFISTLIVVLLNIIPLGKSERIDHAAHFGGLLSGFILGFIAYKGITFKHRYAKQMAMGVAVLLVATFSFITISLTDKYDLYEFEKRKFDATAKLDQISDFFYDNENRYCTHTEKVDFLRKYALPKIVAHRKNIQNLAKLKLPTKLKAEADYIFAYNRLKLSMYELLYLEYKRPANKKYRIAINDLNERILALRAAYFAEKER